MNAIEKINSLRQKAQSEQNALAKVYIHMGTCGIASGAMDVFAALKNLIEKSKYRVKVVKTGCAGICSKEPLVSVDIPGQEPIVYARVNEEKISKIFRRHVMGKSLVTEYAFARGMEYQIKERVKNRPTSSDIPGIEDIPFFALQVQRVMRNRGIIDPDKIDDYIVRDGYQGAVKALTSMSSDHVVDEILKSGLRGRGGAGFPTGLKWKAAANQKSSDVKYLVCNADEGDPGAYMDRNILESDPHSVLEGMIIAAKAIGATRGYIYCRAEYPLAVKTLNRAIGQARSYGLLGKNIFGTELDFDIEIYEGAGAFVCGEETALIHSLEGKRGSPRPRPPYPVASGLWNTPTVINNVETFANIAPIIVNGGDWFASVGTEKSKGTKVFSITGDLNNVGCAEVPIGMTLDTLINQIGGGISDGKQLKAAQLGGPSGGCIPAKHLNISVDFETLQACGAIMGSGGLIVISDDKSAVDIARFFMEFCKDEACGKCVPGREGTKQMLRILNKICSHNAKAEDVATLEELARVVGKTSLCALCRTSVNPVLSTMRYFRNEYVDAISNVQ